MRAFPWISTLIVTALVAPAAIAFTPTEAQRELDVTVDLFTDDDGSGDGVYDEGVAFDPFDAGYYVEANIAEAMGWAYGSQTSSIGSTSILASGATEAGVRIFEENESLSAYAASSSVCYITFVVDEPTAFTLTGQMEGFGGETSLYLSNTEETLVQYSVFSEAWELDESGTLEPGTWWFEVTCETMIAPDYFPAEYGGSGSFDLQLELGAALSVPGTGGRGDHVLAVAPNPARHATRIELGDGIARHGATVSVFDATGRLVRTLRAVTPQVTWDVTDDAGRRVAPGVYFLEAEDVGAVRTGRVLVR